MGVYFPAEAKYWSAFYPTYAGGSFTVLKWPGLQTAHPFPFSDEVKNGGDMSLFFHESSWRGA
jgi:hypothetical protein